MDPPDHLAQTAQQVRAAKAGSSTAMQGLFGHYREAIALRVHGERS